MHPLPLHSPLSTSQRPEDLRVHQNLGRTHPALRVLGTLHRNITCALGRGVGTSAYLQSHLPGASFLSTW